MICGLFVAVAGAAEAQTAAEQPSQVSEIVVTGSRIARPNLDAPTPVSVVDAKAIANTGDANIGNIIRQLPAAGVSGITPTNSGFGVNENGITTVNLRNLGDSRTLVLVNGRRFVPGVPGTNIVDFNDISPEMIDRIDVVTGGASSVYGSDALAGVVNIITKKNFEGLVINGQYGISERGDDERGKIAVTAGTHFAEDRGSAMFSVSYDKIGAIYGRDRCDQDMCIDGSNGDDGAGTNNSYRSTISPFYSTTPPQGAILVGRPGASNATYSYQPDGSILPFSQARDGFNRSAYRILQVPSKRETFNAQINYELTPWAKLFTEATIVHNELHSTIEPTPLASSQLYYDPATKIGQSPFCQAAVGCQYGIPLTSASVPDAVKQLVRAANSGVPDSSLVVGFRRRLTEIGARGNDIDRTTFRVVTGVSGDLTSRISYEVSFNYGRTHDFELTNGDVNINNFRNAVDTVDLGGGNIVCRDPNARAKGCVPLNVFGAGSISPAAANYVRSASSRDSQLEEFVINGFVNAKLWDLPAGTVNAVFGSEYREERSQDEPDPLTQSGGTSGNATPATNGKFKVSEIFAELRVPLLADLPYVKSLDLNLSGRFSDYSTVSSTTAWAASLEYQPVSWLKFRTQYSRAVRAPDIGELYSPAVQNFPSVKDPCEGVTAASSGALVNGGIAANCLADPAVLARVQRDGIYTQTQTEKQGVTGFDGGAATLRPETAKTWTVGLLFNPRWYKWTEPFSLSVDYFNIDIDNVIDALLEQTSLDHCYGAAATSFQPGSVFCSNVQRIASGPDVGALYAVNRTNANLARRQTAGVDVQASYNLALNDLPYLSSSSWQLGSLLNSLVYTYLDKFDLTPFQGAGHDDIIHDAGTVGFARSKWQLNTVYTNRAFQWSVQTNYIGRSKLYFNDSPNPVVGGRVFVNTQLRYNITDSITGFFGVDNLFDKYVRFGGTNGDTGQAAGWTTYPDIYDGIGRRYYTGLRLRF